MALGKNVKKDKLIPSKPKKEEKTVKAKKKPATTPAKKVAPKAKKTAEKKAKSPAVEHKIEKIEVASEVVGNIKENPQLAKAKRVLPANFLTKEEMEERNRLKAKYDQDILKLRGKSVQLIVFKLGGERYALEIDKVKEIVPAPQVSKLPRAPKFMKGVANIRGAVMVIMDLEEKFELFKSEEISEKTFTLVIKNERFKAGILVSEVPTTLKVPGDIIESSSGIMSNTVLDETFIKGLIKQEEGMIILLDIIELIESDEIRVIAESVEDGN
ncbi:Chemotaxis signal transduction protein [Reichenbachiella faecimaris]|uniref:Chemotaxis signal transduction protein n=1 Tax=Reichenbachiella faecimaris TaxID=692418 RepID=A0A1W2G8J1_REIFA|nr:chemotaxis protein CheW [Reichenbachiella faecimaris]SMD32921.1 Chemotaxis signal transduction protein [Reichenbachiella faecimaris]